MKKQSFRMQNIFVDHTSCTGILSQTVKALFAHASFTLVTLFLSLTIACGEPPAPQKTPSGEAVIESKAQENHGGVVLHIHRVLLDYSAASAGVYYDWQVKESIAKGKQIIYFEVSVANTSPDAKYITHTDFSLEDANGVTYKESQTLDWINATVQPNKSVRGGIAFEIPKACVPGVLVYDMGLRDKSTGEKTICRQKLSDLGKKLGLSEAPVPTSSPATQFETREALSPTVGDVHSPILSIEDMKTFLQKNIFTIPASMLPMQGDVLLSGERASIYVRDIYLMVDVRGTGKSIQSVSCVWLATFSKTTDGAKVAESSEEWRLTICNMVGGRNPRLNDWITKCNIRWVSQPKGEMVTDSTTIDGIKYAFAGSVKTGSMEITITRPH